MENGVSTIIFDLGGVILNLDYNRTIEAFKNLGQENFDELYTQANQNRTFDRFETGDITAKEFRDYIRTFLGNEITDLKIDEAWNEMLLDLPAERIDLLNQLKKRYKIYLFSNTNEIHLKKFRQIIEESFGYPDVLEETFHKTYYSHLIGRRKPNASAFQFILDENNLKPEEVVFIDDSIQHVQGASELGINAEHLIDTDILTLCKRFA